LAGRHVTWEAFADDFAYAARAPRLIAAEERAALIPNVQALLNTRLGEPIALPPRRPSAVPLPPGAAPGAGLSDAWVARLAQLAQGAPP
jgi:hypothetical protein